MKPPSKKELGFTLIELLVVLSLVGALIVLVGPRFAQSDKSNLRQAEAMVAGLLRTARSAAIMNGREARLVVDFDPMSPDYLSTLAVVVENESNQWVLVGSPTKLPATVCVVPTSSVPTIPGVTWSNSAQSSMSQPVTLSVDLLPSGTYRYIDFTSAGTLRTLNTKLVIAVCQKDSRTPSARSFVSLDMIRIFMMRSSGVYTLLQKASGS